MVLLLLDVWFQCVKYNLKNDFDSGSHYKANIISTVLSFIQESQEKAKETQNKTKHVGNTKYPMIQKSEDQSLAATTTSSIHAMSLILTTSE